MQKSLESVSEQLRIPGSKSLGPIGQVRCVLLGDRKSRGRSMFASQATIDRLSG